MNIEVKVIRTIWKLVETSNPHSILNLSNQELRQKLMMQVAGLFSLTEEDNFALSKYIDSKQLLIRDLAYAKVI